jgi:conjugative relaxase-like TrwC/TraI family protein
MPLGAGSGAEAMGLKGQRFDPEAYCNLLYGMEANGDSRLVGRAHSHHKYAGLDFPLAAPKSLSVAAAYDPELRDAIKRAAISTAEGVEKYVHGRKTSGGQTEEVQGKMVAAVFMHGTSRSNDAHSHAHVFIINMVIRPDGSFGTLENKEIFRHQREIMQDFYSHLALETKGIGYGIELRVGKKGQVIPELASYRKDINELFSKRQNTIKSSDKLLNDIQRRMPHLSPKAIESLVQLQTKQSKSIGLSECDLARSHTAQMAMIGVDANQYMAKLKSGGLQYQNEVHERPSAAEYISLVLKNSTFKEGRFSPERIINNAVKLSVGECSRPELETAYSTALKFGEIIAYTESVHTTPEMEKIEARIERNLYAEHIAHGQSITMDKTQGDYATIFTASAEEHGMLLNEKVDNSALCMMAHDAEPITDNKEKPIEAFRGEQEKSNTIEYSSIDERLDELKAEIAELTSHEAKLSDDESSQQNQQEQHYEVERISNGEQDQETSIEM